MHSGAMLKMDSGLYIGSTLWALLKPSLGCMSLGLTRNIDRSSYPYEGNSDYDFPYHHLNHNLGTRICLGHLGVLIVTSILPC